MNEYQGMRWYKCDLHLHTPEDSQHWLDRETRLGDPRRSRIDGKFDEQKIQETARKYLHRCHEVGLQVIGVTEHNFSARSEPRDWFLLHLIEQNNSVARDRGVAPLVIFPGFEVDIGYHVLCLFQPVAKQKGLEEINSVLTKLGLSENERFPAGKIAQLRHNDQKVSLKKLLEIVQREYKGIVIAAHADQKDGILSNSDHKGDYAHPGLYCVELTQERPDQKYTDILARKNTDWQREGFHPAWIMSSDAKSLAQNETGQPKANSLGYRHTWIKMSEPSIEALRQAFLDPESRIQPAGEDPAKQEKHACIVSVSVAKTAFLDKQKIVFSPNLNCIIGGRGSGKSAILEGMRLAMGKDDDPKLDARAREKVERIQNLLTKNVDSEVRLLWRNGDGVEDTLVYSVPQAGSGVCRVDGRDMQDLTAFLRDLPVQFFSQQQLNQITAQGGNVLLALLDEFAREELKPLLQKEAELRREIEQHFAVTTTLEQIEKDLQRLHQEHIELERQWEARSALQEDARQHQGLKAEQAYIQKLKNGLEDEGARLTAVVDDIYETHSPLGSIVDRWPHGDWFKEKDAQLWQAKETLKEAVGQAVATYRKTFSSVFEADPQWLEIKQHHEQADAEFSRVCAEKGIAPDDVSRIQEISQKRTGKKLELEQKTKERLRLQQVQQRLPDLFHALHENWLACFQVRQRLADEITQAARSDNKLVIELHVEYFADDVLFQKVWGKLSLDGRTKLGRNWEEIGSIVRKEYLSERAKNLSERAKSHPSLWDMLQSWMENEATTPDSIRTRLRVLQLSISEIKSHLFDSLRKTWQDTRMMRLDDVVDLVLYCDDGVNEEGRISAGTLSDGQRNTAALAMLLARGNHPLVIDQPEDELDSNFIFHQLVPMLRRLKSSRQIILATHNANLPVNGDAELVYALRAREGRGEKLAAGGLDRKDVADAVLDIMEGSAQAFQQRKEKYHF
ncbi:MAG: AAA family ATPase [Magnetococcales bacterium]|nr:AAA family ATPase [Magnetococcales bacterium]